MALIPDHMRVGVLFLCQLSFTVASLWSFMLDSLPSVRYILAIHPEHPQRQDLHTRSPRRMF